MAVSGYFDAVQEIYIAFYQRPADPAGLRFWAEHLEAEDGDLSAIVDAFANSTEAQRLYGPIDDETIGDVISNIYQSLFGRAPDDAGKAHYEAAFASGALNAGNIALAILNASQNNDKEVVANKLLVANRFTEKVDGRPFDNPEFGKGDDFAYDYTEEGKAAAARKALAGVTADPKSMLDDAGVKDVLDDKAPAPGNSGPVGRTYELTAGHDNITGQSGNDKFIAKLVENPVHHAEMSLMAPQPEWLPTLNDGDKINGGAGRDTLTAEILGYVTPGALTSIETVVLSGQGALDLVNATGVEHIQVKGMDQEKLAYGPIFLGEGEDSSPAINLDIGVAALTVENLGAPLKSLTITDTLGLVAINHGMIVSDAQPSKLTLNLRDAIGVVAISGKRVAEAETFDAETGKPVYGSLAIDSGSVRGTDAYGNYVLLAGSTPSEITVTGKANLGFATGLMGSEDGKMPELLNARDFKGNLAAVMVGGGDTQAIGGQGDDLLAFVSLDNAPSLLSMEAIDASVMDMPISAITVDAGAGDDCLVFVSNANVDARGGSGNDNFVFFDPMGLAGFNAGDSVDGGEGTDTLWLAVEGRYDEGPYRLMASSTELFGDEPDGGNNISGIEHVVHIAPSGMYGDLHVDMTRVDAGTVLELAADYDGYDVTVDGIANSNKAVDVILSGHNVGNLAILSEKEEIGLTIRTVSDESRDSLLDWLAEEIGEEVSLDVLARLHDSETYARVLSLLKQTHDDVGIDSLSLGETTTSLNLVLEGEGHAYIHDLFDLGENVSTIKIQGGADLSLGIWSAFQGREIDAASTSGDLELYVGSSVTNVSGGSGNNTVHVRGAEVVEIDVGAGGSDKVTFDSSIRDAADMERASFSVNISNFEVGSDKIVIDAGSAINAESISGGWVNSDIEPAMYEVGVGSPDVPGPVSVDAYVSLLKFASTTEAGEGSFAELFIHAIGSTQLIAGDDANLLAVMYDAESEEAVLFTVNSGDDLLLDGSDAGSIKVITTIGMDEGAYADFDAANIAWMYSYN